MKHSSGAILVSIATILLGATAHGQTDGVAAAKANIDRYSRIPTFEAPGEAFDAKACMAGKAIFTIPASSSIPFIKTITDHKHEIAKQLSFEHSEWENQGNPTQWIQSIDFAINNNFDLISLLAGADPRFFEPQVKAARDAGLAVVTAHLTGLEQDVPGGVTSSTAIDYKTAGSLLADWSIAQTGGNVNALVLVSNEALSTDSMVSGLTEAFAVAMGQLIDYDEAGNVMGASLMDFFLPTAVETPVWETDYTEVPSPHHPIGAKGVGESPHVGGVPAFSNAVNDAFAGLGGVHTHMPHTAPNIWRYAQDLGLAR